ncbi:MAG: hypothetical protein ACP5FH_02530 [Terracidiphilus sp.]
MKSSAMTICVATLTLLVAVPGLSESSGQQGQGRAIVTVLPKRTGQALPEIRVKDLSVKVNRKEARITDLMPFKGTEGRVELVLLIDSSARMSLGTQLNDIANYIQSLPANTRAAIAYMFNGKAFFAGPLSADHAQVLRELHLPGGLPGSSASPYICLSDLARRWPSKDRMARRVAVMVTDGVDYYERRYDPEDPYVLAAITDSVRAGLSVYAIYWLNQGFASRTYYAMYDGQNLLQEVTDATGGISYWQGTGNPVTFVPYFEDLSRRLANQYEIVFTCPLRGKAEAEDLKVKLDVAGAKLDAPQRAWVVPAGF